MYCVQCGKLLSKDFRYCPYCGINLNSPIPSKIYANTNAFEIRAGVLVKYYGSDRSVIIPNGVVCIGRGAFKDLFGLEQVTFPEGLIRIDSEAFSGCKMLKNPIFPKSLKEIGWGSFENCENITSVSFSDNIIKIQPGAFNRCSNLKKVIMPNNNNGPKRLDREYDVSAFRYCDKLTDVYLPNRSWIDCLEGTPYIHSLRIKQQQETEKYRRSKGLCLHCGGKFKFKGFFDVVCSDCGRNRDY